MDETEREVLASVLNDLKAELAAPGFVNADGNLVKYVNVIPLQQAIRLLTRYYALLAGGAAARPEDDILRDRVDTLVRALDRARKDYVLRGDFTRCCVTGRVGSLMLSGRREGHHMTVTWAQTPDRQALLNTDSRSFCPLVDASCGGADDSTCVACVVEWFGREAEA